MQEILDLYNKYVEEGLLPIGHQGNQHQKTAVSTIAAELKIPRRKVYSIVAASVPKPVTEGLITEKRSDLCDAAGNVLKYWDKKRQPRMPPEEANWLPGSGKVTSVSTNIDHQGNVISQWISEKPEEINREKLWMQCAEALAANVPRAAPAPYNKDTYLDLCVGYPIGDHHIGMYSWHEETGADYDIEIAQQLLHDAFSHLILATPPCQQAVVVSLGDILHYDSNEAVTPAHKNLLDADGRAQKMLEAGVESIRNAINIALSHHAQVHVIFVPGNHDPYSTKFLRIMFAAFYENEPRVTVDKSPADYHYYEFGKNLIGTHHGHGAKMDSLPGIMACDQAEAWGRTKHRVWWTGHNHHQQLKDFPGCTVESFRILAAPDAYAAQKGYRAKRGMQAVVLHREFGEVARHTVNPSMFAAKRNP